MRALPLDRREEGSRAREEGETRALFFANCPPSFFEFLCVSFFFCSFFAVSTSLILPLSRLVLKPLHRQRQAPLPPRRHRPDRPHDPGRPTVLLQARLRRTGPQVAPDAPRVGPRGRRRSGSRRGRRRRSGGCDDRRSRPCQSRSRSRSDDPRRAPRLSWIEARRVPRVSHPGVGGAPEERRRTTAGAKGPPGLGSSRTPSSSPPTRPLLFEGFFVSARERERERERERG